MKTLTTTLFSIALLTGANAANITLPGTAPGPGLNTVIRQFPRVYQEYIDESQLASITQPIEITGIRFRLAIGDTWRPVGYVGASWPNADITFSDWTMQIGQGSAAAIADGEFLSAAVTFNGNMEAAPVTTRTGSLTLLANSFAADGGVVVGAIHSFGPLISFSTPYTYNPGETLVYAVAHSGYGSAGTPLNAFFDSAAFGNSVADAVSSTAAGANFGSAPTSFAIPYIVQFEYTVIPEPGSSVVLLMAGAVLLRRRQRA
jgi:hypothetical protein